MKFRGRGKSRLPELEKRKQATQATLDRYRNKAFDWATGVTCVHLARYHLRNMGHRPPSLPRFRSAFGARKAMQERGWESVTEMLDTMLPRIPPAKMMLGDLAVVEGSDGMESIVVCTGPLALLGWLPSGEKMAVYLNDISHVTASWRV